MIITIGSYKIKNNSLWQEAMTHRSIGSHHNERLEFLGDSALNAIISKQLFIQNDQYSEGELSSIRSQRVDTKTLTQLGYLLKLDTHLKTSHAQKSITPKLMANAFEAVVGAVLCDSNWDTCEHFVLQCYQQLPNLPNKAIKHPKAALQEYTQSKALPLPKYHIHQTIGDAHCPTFIIACTLEQHTTYSKSVSLKQEGEAQAALNMLRLIKDQS